MTESNNTSNRSSAIATTIGCLLFPILFFSLSGIGMFILSASSEESYKPGEVPDRGFSVLVRIPGYDRLNKNEITDWRWSVDQKEYLDERHPGWSFYEPVRSGSIETGEFSFIRWSVEEVSTTRKRIELEWGDDDGSLFSTYEIENNQITPVSRKNGINPGYAMASAIPALIISIILCLLLEKLCNNISRNIPLQYQQLDE
ncbi:MAG: hypothetical protein QNJ61_13745 [Desulfobacterales bacterium]|nr:hypothetical protein [Desulfobacterales bacterium]